MEPKQVDRLVLCTVNAPWKRHLSAVELADAVVTVDRGLLPHLANFFGEVDGGLIVAFATLHGIDQATLYQSYRMVEQLTATTNKDLEVAFAGMGVSA
ncbi:hypothetical protein [Azospirillum canadense]|uniref:hypothetical protein n=1 Tax=Azospirillum canadense TaxID=403962 RepID=UPI002227F384|nr:hypothetical protein [Azospirillum canadense]MCW2240764.1 hypothetical protein [Azospirillum canadense]